MSQLDLFAEEKETEPSVYDYEITPRQTFIASEQDDPSTKPIIPTNQVLLQTAKGRMRVSRLQMDEDEPMSEVDALMVSSIVGIKEIFEVLTANNKKLKNYSVKILTDNWHFFDIATGKREPLGHTQREWARALRSYRVYFGHSKIEHISTQQLEERYQQCQK